MLLQQGMNSSAAIADVSPGPALCCRLIFVLDGTVQIAYGAAEHAALHADDYAYLPPGTQKRWTCSLATRQYRLTVDTPA